MSKTKDKGLNWIAFKLYDGKNFTGFKVKLCFDGLFRVIWPDGVESEDYYNLTHARENAIKAYKREEYLKTVSPEPLRAS